MTKSLKSNDNNFMSFKLLGNKNIEVREPLEDFHTKNLKVSLFKKFVAALNGL